MKLSFEGDFRGDCKVDFMGDFKGEKEDSKGVLKKRLRGSALT